MVARARGYIRRAIFRTYRRLKHPRHLKQSPALRWFAQHFLDKYVWRPTQHTMSGGMGVGVFVSAQLLPGQMPLAIILAAMLRFNIPTAVAVSWLSNPVTFAPIGLLEKKIGDWVQSWYGNPTLGAIEQVASDNVAKGVQFAQSMYLGGILLGLALVPVAYVLTWLTWEGVHRWSVKHPIHLPHRLHKK